MTIKENVRDTNMWLRGLFILIYGIILYFAFGIVWLMVIFQFFMKLITRELNTQILDFSGSLNRYISQLILYITFKSEERPFPFSPWPGNEKSNPARIETTQTDRE